MRHVPKRRIAAEKLISAQTGNRHFEPQFPSGLADEPCVEPIDRGLVHGIENFRQVVAKLLLGHKTCDMSRAILRRNLLCYRRLILTPTAEFLKGQSHRLDILLPRIAHQTDEGAGVDSAGKECTNWDIGHKMMAHAVEERLAEADLQIFIVSRHA